MLLTGAAPWKGVFCRNLCVSVIMCVVFLSLDVVGYASSRLPFVGEKSPVILRKRPGCYMDGKHYEFGERWSPVFIPQGLMVCIRCECLSVDKKGVFQAAGETMCRNIKDLCPVPSCPDPVLRPGKCCKACPEDEAFEDSFSFSPRALANEVFSLDAAHSGQVNDFQAFLVGRRVPGFSVRTRAVALVRLTISKGAVHLSVRYTRLDRPKYLRLVDNSGNVLYQTPVMKGINGDRKACGTWSKVPPSYENYFRDEKLFAVITTSRYPDGIVGGRIRAVKDLNRETFSSLMVSSKPNGEGVHASIAYNARTKIAAYTITRAGVRGNRGKGKLGTFTISIMKGSHVIYRTRGSSLPKTTKLSGKWRVFKRLHRKHLARGRLRMRITFSSSQTLMTGDIQPKLTCDVFQAVLSSGQTKSKKRSASAGSAIVRIGDNGRLQYSIRLSGLEREISQIQIEGHNLKSSARAKAIGKLRYSFVPDSKKSPDGWAHGTFKRMEAEDVYRLLNNQLFISVTTGRRDSSDLKGRLVALGYHEHFQENVPTTLNPATEQAFGGAASAWLSLDVGCVLHYDVLLTGKGKRSGPFGLLLGSHGNSSREMAVLRPPVGKRGEVIYQYRHVSGDVLDLPDDIFHDLDQGNVYVQINAKKRGQAVYKGNVTMPNNCWRNPNDMDSRTVDDSPEVDVPLVEEDPFSTQPCRFEGLFYSEGTAWIPDVDPTCTTCSCVKGKTLCQKMICPKLDCPEPVQLEGRCCPSCPDEDSSEVCQLGRDPRKYPVNSVWHPYLPTQGFTTCATCTCKHGRKVECTKLPCPVLECPKSEWVPSRTDKCCYQCGPKMTTEAPVEEPQGDVNMEGTCNFLGEIKTNGEKWHPNVRPFGYLKCFYCECQDGEFTCGRLTCPKLDCAFKVKHRNVCCEQCADDQTQIPPGKNDGGLTEETSQTCVFAGKKFQNGEKWKPSVTTSTDGTDCAICKCTAGSTKCRLKCPKVCLKDNTRHKCCKHCPETDLRHNTTTKKKKKRRKSDQKTSDDRRSKKRKSASQGQGRKVRRRKGTSRKRSKQRDRQNKLSSSQQFFAMLST